MDDDPRGAGGGPPPRSQHYDQGSGAPSGGGFEDGGPRAGDGGPSQGGEREHRPQQAVKSTNPADHTGVLKMRGLPFSASKQDIIGWFSDISNLSGDGYAPLYSSFTLCIDVMLSDLLQADSCRTFLGRNLSQCCTLSMSVK